MKKTSLILLALNMLISVLVLAQEADITKGAQMIQDAKPDTNRKWHKGGLLSVCLTQASFSNWAAGGQNSLGLTAISSLHANYRSDKFSWLNDAELGYGTQKVDDMPAQKTTDQIELTSSVGYNLFDHTSLSFLTNFQTQFQPGYTNAGDSILLSNFMAPAYWVLALGLQYARPKGLHIFVSPITARLTFVENTFLSDEGAFGVAPGKRELTQVGAYIKANYSATILKNIMLTTNLELFSNYLKDPQNIIVNWSTFIQLKVNKYISATLNTQLIYDNNVLVPVYREEGGVLTLVGKGPRLQFKDLSGIGIAINLK